MNVLIHSDGSLKTQFSLWKQKRIKSSSRAAPAQAALDLQTWASLVQLPAGWSLPAALSASSLLSRAAFIPLHPGWS